MKGKAIPQGEDKDHKALQEKPHSSGKAHPLGPADVNGETLFSLEESPGFRTGTARSVTDSSRTPLQVSQIVHCSILLKLPSFRPPNQ